LQVNFISDTKFTLTALSVGNETLTIKGSDRGETQLSVTISPDPDKAFKEDATVRIEVNGNVSTLDHTFVVDKGGSLLGSSQVKVGSTLDGNTYTLIGWDPGEGRRNPKLYTQEVVIPLSNLQMLQEKDGKIWLIGTNPSLTIKVCTEF
jgi:hypothetical protein